MTSERNDIKIICKVCQLKSADISELDLRKHNNHILDEKVKKLKKNIEELQSMIEELQSMIEELQSVIEEKVVDLGKLCYICELTREISDIEDLCKKNIEKQI